MWQLPGTGNLSFAEPSSRNNESDAALISFNAIHGVSNTTRFGPNLRWQRSTIGITRGSCRHPLVGSIREPRKQVYACGTDEVRPQVSGLSQHGFVTNRLSLFGALRKVCNESLA